MASLKLAYMPQDPSLISPYLQKGGLRSKSKGDLWSTPSASPATPASKPVTASAMWGPPLPVLNNQNNLSSPIHSAPAPPAPPNLGHPSLASLTANSEPITTRETPATSAISSPVYAHTPLSSSRLASRQNSRSASPSPIMGPMLPGSLKPPTMAVNPPAMTNFGPTNAVPNDEIINTAIVVKNIPFAIKKEQLIEFMTQLGLPLPYAFNYHFDNGVFRGLAFANFASAEETAAVITSLNGRELGGRRLRVEYKKMLPYQERERIEREKRERRGQLEEQHQKSEAPANSGSSGSANASANVNGTNVNSANASVANANGANANAHSTAVNTPINASLNAPINPQINANMNVPLSTPLVNAMHEPRRGLSLNHYYAVPVDFNDPEILDTYSSLLMFKHDPAGRELVIPAPQTAQLLPPQTYVLQALCDRLDLHIGLNEEQSLFIAKRADRSFADEHEPYLSGILRHAVSPKPLLRPKTTPVASMKPAALGHAAPAALHHHTFPNVVSNQITPSAAHTSGYHRWNSVENLAGSAGAGAGFAK